MRPLLGNVWPRFHILPPDFRGAALSFRGFLLLAASLFFLSRSSALPRPRGSSPSKQSHGKKQRFFTGDELHEALIAIQDGDAEDMPSGVQRTIEVVMQFKSAAD